MMVRQIKDISAFCANDKDTSNAIKFFIIVYQ